MDYIETFLVELTMELLIGVIILLFLNYLTSTTLFFFDILPECCPVHVVW